MTHQDGGVYDFVTKVAKRIQSSLGFFLIPKSGLFNIWLRHLWLQFFQAIAIQHMKGLAGKWNHWSTNICRNFFNQISFAPDMNRLAADPARVTLEVLWWSSTLSSQNSSRCQFYQQFTCSFFVQKCCAQLFCARSCVCAFLGKRKLSKKLLIKCCRNWLKVGMVAGGVASCGDKDIPGYYTRIDYPEIANFIQAPEVYSSTGNLKAK